MSTDGNKWPGDLLAAKIGADYGVALSRLKSAWNVVRWAKS